MTTTKASPPGKAETYLFFEGRCDEAIEFYRRSLGAEVTALMRFKESPEPAACPTASGDKVMHACIRIGETNLMASDGRCSGNPSFQGFALTLAMSTVAEAERVFTALTDGGEVQMPMAETFFSPRFGMVADRFGVSWMVMVEACPEATTSEKAKEVA
ncbi:MAG: VOC family protein [Limisphaerales bacterium]